MVKYEIRVDTGKTSANIKVNSKKCYLEGRSGWDPGGNIGLRPIRGRCQSLVEPRKIWVRGCRKSRASNLKTGG